MTIEEKIQKMNQSQTDWNSILKETVLSDEFIRLLTADKLFKLYETGKISIEDAHSVITAVFEDFNSKENKSG